MLDVTPAARAQTFLDRFGEALDKPDIEAAVAMFAEDSYWRDLVSFTWNIKTVEGRDADPGHADPLPRDGEAARLARRREGAGDGGRRRARGVVHVRDRGRARLRPRSHQGRPHLDVADHHGRAQGFRGEGRASPARSAPGTASMSVPRAGRRRARRSSRRSASRSSPMS